jgi:3-dehydroquinate dehydratase
VHLPGFYVIFFFVVVICIFVVVFVCIEEVIIVIIEVIIALIIRREMIRHDVASAGFAAGSAGLGFAGGGYVVQKCRPHRTHTQN